MLLFWWKDLFFTKWFQWIVSPSHRHWKSGFLVHKAWIIDNPSANGCIAITPIIVILFQKMALSSSSMLISWNYPITFWFIGSKLLMPLTNASMNGCGLWMRFHEQGQTPQMHRYTARHRTAEIHMKWNDCYYHHISRITNVWTRSGEGNHCRCSISTVYSFPFHLLMQFDIWKDAITFKMYENTLSFSNVILHVYSIRTISPRCVVIVLADVLMSWCRYGSST